jgi:predicted metal-dependent HD superfamily phosphohydrolase
MATKSHKSEITDNDLDLFLDFDISILAKNWEGYRRYSEQIRQEYIHYPDNIYKPGRIKVLNLLMSGGLFRTQLFQEKFEEKAKENMTKEIFLLQTNQ